MFRFKNLLWELWLPVLLVVLWFVISARSTNFFFPSLANIMQRFGEVWFWEGIVENLIPSFLRILAGFFLALIMGIGLGTILGLMPKLENAIHPVLEFLRATPGVALLPIAVIFLGLGDGMKIFMIALACMWPILLNTIDGIRSVEPVLLYAAKSYRIPLWDRIRYIYMPHSAPQIFTGCRLSISIAAVVLVITEMIGSPGGIGYFVLDSQRSFDITNMWTGIIMLGILGYVLNLGFRFVEKHVLDWHNKKNA